ncbi:MAG: gamma-glutamylcyclotransferase [Rhodospirillales bacterium]|nr:gamma-glutamylcyclotransferase [Rhodospirillales bacterium]
MSFDAVIAPEETALSAASLPPSADALCGDDYGAGVAAPPPYTPDAETLLARRRPVWIFAYGSLMWHPGFAHDAAEPALLRGWHRSFCLYSRRYRGTPENPGLVLGLDRGGACRGRAFRVPGEALAEAFAHLWPREMSGGAYDFRPVTLCAEAGPVSAWAFTVRRDHLGYAGRLGIDETARLIRQGVGGRGRCSDYLANTVRHLECLGLRDGPLHRLEERVASCGA